MERNKSPLKPGLWLALAIIAVTAVLSVAAYTNPRSLLDTIVFPFTIHHWLSYLGGTFIIVYSPAFYYLKRRDKAHYQAYTTLHAFGNLFSFTLISIHFAGHLNEYGSIIMYSRTGLPLYFALLLMLISGVNLRFQVSRKWLKLSRSLHMSFMTAFYLIIAFHILHGASMA